MSELIERFFIFQFITEFIQVIFGAGLCFGALKWRRGSLTSTAVIWGLLLGLWIGSSFLSSGSGSFELLIICCALGMLIFPILTYTVPGVNRFVLGFLFGTKFVAMITTILFKEGSIDIIEALVSPLIAGTLIGLIMMAWIQMRVMPFVLCSTFIGASSIAPTIAEWINRGGFIITGSSSFLPDPIDLLFALFKIELTDTITLLVMATLLILGCAIQLSRLKTQGIPYDTPIIGFEIPCSENEKETVA